MKGPWGLSRPWALAAAGLMAAEVCIALFARDAFVRPYLGDILVMPLMYAGLRAFYRRPGISLPAVLLGIALLTEGLQLVRMTEVTGLSAYPVLTVIAGSQADGRDVLCYLAGTGINLLCEWRLMCRRC